MHVTRALKPTSTSELPRDPRPASGGATKRLAPARRDGAGASTASSKTCRHCRRSDLLVATTRVIRHGLFGHWATGGAEALVERILPGSNEVGRTCVRAPPRPGSVIAFANGASRPRSSAAAP
jgi:hypothetical protein